MGKAAYVKLIFWLERTHTPKRYYREFNGLGCRMIEAEVCNFDTVLYQKHMGNLNQHWKTDIRCTFSYDKIKGYWQNSDLS